jgi:uncharacterized membrane protein
MPEKMASHWNARGEVDGYLPKFWGLFLMPLITLGLYGLFKIIPKIDPLRKNILKFKKYYFGMIVTVVGFLFYLYLVTIAANLGFQFNMNLLIIPALAILFFYIGILIKHAKRNWFVGIRTPWTLSSDKVWKKTHEIGSKLFKIYAVFILFTLLFQQLLIEYFLWIILVPILSIVIGLFAYSYFEYQKKR